MRRVRVATAGAACALAAAVWLVRVGRSLLLDEQAGSPAQVFADTSRSLGIAALLLACATLPVGLVVGRRLLAGRGVGAELRALHTTLSLSALAVIVAHVAVLLGAANLAPNLADLVVPFQWAYRSLYTGLGVLGFWVIALLGLSYYQRARLGPRGWRIAHRFIALGLVLSVIHTIGGG